MNNRLRNQLIMVDRGILVGGLYMIATILPRDLVESSSLESRVCFRTLLLLKFRISGISGGRLDSQYI